MAVTQRLELRQSQSLVMTPQLQQAIKLLQLSNLELAAYVDTEIEQNPLLERAEPDDWSGADAAPEEARAQAPEADADSLDHAVSDHLPQAGDAPLDSEISYDDNSPSDHWGTAGPAGAAGGSSGGFEDEDRTLDERLAQPRSLRDHLMEQAGLTFDDPVERAIAVFLIDSLDEAGYLTISPEEVAGQLGCTEALVAATIRRLQRFEPTGLFARSLAECLALQLAERDRLDPCMRTLLDHLDLVAARDFARLRRLCGADEEDLAEMLAELRSLDPRPALAFGGGLADSIVPDILLRPAAAGGWLIELNPETMPRVLVNAGYHRQLVRGCRRRAEREYVSERLQAANWLVRALEQRANTILKVAGEIVRRQEAFFRLGVQGLRPLTLRDVADAVQLHESTVSRVTANKYMATPRGNFELKYFFTTAIAGVAGGDHSAEAVRHRIKALVDAEAPDAVLSDDAIVETLRGEGIDIARRTVAKYRDVLRIPSSVQRRREKALAI